MSFISADVAAPHSEESSERSSHWPSATGVRAVFASAAVALSLLATTAFAASNNSYSVQTGDTVDTIAVRYGITARDLESVNKLARPELNLGQTLVVPVADSLTRDPARPVADAPKLELDRAAPTSRGGRSALPFSWPTVGVISTVFGTPGPLWRLGYHPGLDIAAPTGTPIEAVGDGLVVEAGPDNLKGYGNYVKIDHGDGLVTLYAHMSRWSVSVGDTVERGEVIGYVGSTGVSTGPHLHIEVRHNGELKDPEHYLHHD